jgi:outer membrane protein OmpA-like peptidoglycan-associated protein
VKIKQDNMLSGTHWHQKKCSHGGAAPVLMVCVALLVAVAYFFLVTKGKMEQRSAEARSGEVAAVEKGDKEAAASRELKQTPQPPMEEEKKEVPAAASVPEKPRFGFARAVDLGKDLAQSLTRKDWLRAGHLAVAGQGEGADLEEVRRVFEALDGMGFRVAANESVGVMGQVDQYTRLMVPFTGPDDEVLRLQLDVSPDAKMGWKVEKFRLPEAMLKAVAEAASGAGEEGKAAEGSQAMKPDEKMAASAAVEPSGGMKGADMKPEEAVPDKVAGGPSMGPGLGGLFQSSDAPDVLTHVNDFVRLLLNHDFAAAREFLDESRVPPQRLAGLCIVFEEGKYELMPNKPLMVTATVADASWVVAKVQSETLAQQTEFGIELQRQAEDMPWQVVGLNLSDMLGSFAKSASQLGVPYTPIVKNPKGGESLALYFEYDDAGLHPRAQKQLQIVADMLKSDASRKLRIAGHTDALGDDNYNLKLSRQRAASVKSELVALGVPPEQVDITGLGKEQPLGPNQKSDGSDDPEGRSRNRRAEIYLDF